MSKNIYIGNNLITKSDSEEIICAHRVTAMSKSELPEWTGISLPEGVTTLGPYLFSGSDMTSFVVPETVTSIEAGCFKDCTNLQSITLPSGLKYLGESCFSGCTGLVSIDLPSSLEYIGPSCFYGCQNLESITIPEAITELPDYCLSNCYALTREGLVLHDNIVSFGDYCFSDCGSLGFSTLPASLKRIGKYCFYYTGGSDIESLTLPASIEFIGEDAFDNGFMGVSNCRYVRFEGDFPVMDRYALAGLYGQWDENYTSSILTIYYPADNSTWTQEAINTLTGPEEGYPAGSSWTSYYGISNGEGYTVEVIPQ